jgi:hypothetical protein
MVFPWNRSGNAATDVAPVEGRRRSRTRRNRRDEARAEPSRLSRERRHQKIAVAVGSFLMLVIFGIVVFGFYEEFYKPPRVWAGSVGEVEFTMGDLVERIRVLQGLSGQVDLSTVPFEYLRDMLSAQVLRRASPGLGINIIDEDVEEAIKKQFYPSTEGQTADPGQLDEEYRNNYQIFLARTGLQDSDFREIMKERLALVHLHALLGSTIEDSQEHVEVQWIRMQPQDNVDSTAVRHRLDSEAFAKVASEISGQSAIYAGPSGYVGWVPRGAFPELDDVLFGNEETGKEALQEDEISDPLFTQSGIYIVEKLSGPAEQEISDRMRIKLNNELVMQWQNDQQLRGSDEGWLKMNFNSRYYAWVADQVKLSAPRTGPPAQGGNPLGQR